jgi:hypothetical protein
MDESTHVFFRNKLVYLYNNFTRYKKKNEYNEITSDDYVILNSNYIEPRVLENEIENLVSIIYKKMESDIPRNDKMLYFYEFMTLFRLMLHTRDFEYGKGEREYTYMILNSIYKYYPELAVAGVELLLGLYESDTIELNDGPSIIFGCWKDIQYLCNYIREHNNNNKDHPFINWCIYIMVLQLEKDFKIISKSNKNKPNMRKTINPKLSLCAKWVPRENKQFGWLFKKLAVLWSYRNTPDHIIEINTNYMSNPIAYKKCYMNFRKMVSIICNKLNITERNMCSQKWSKIIPRTINIQTMIRNKNAFMNENDSENMDRIECSQNIKSYLYSYNKTDLSYTGNIQLYNTYSELYRYSSKLCNIPLSYFVKEGFRFLDKSESEPMSEEEIYLNKLWKKYIENYITLTNFIPILDISLEIYGNDNTTYYNAIGLACLVCEKSTINKRIIISNDLNNTWINLNNCNDFTSILRTLIPFTKKLCFIENDKDTLVTKIKHLVYYMCNSGMSDDTIGKIVFFVVQNNVKPKNQNNKIRNIFIDPEWALNIPVPYFIYWNLSNSHIEYNDIDTLIDKTVILSGSSPLIINKLSKISYNKDINPHDIIYEILFNYRYNMAEHAFVDIMSTYL